MNKKELVIMCDTGGGVSRKKKLQGLFSKTTVFQNATRLLDPLPPPIPPSADTSGPRPITPDTNVSRFQIKYNKKSIKDRKFIGNKPINLLIKKHRVKEIPKMTLLGYFNY